MKILLVIAAVYSYSLYTLRKTQISIQKKGTNLYIDKSGEIKTPSESKKENMVFSIVEVEDETQPFAVVSKDNKRLTVDENNKVAFLPDDFFQIYESFKKQCSFKENAGQRICKILNNIMDPEQTLIEEDEPSASTESKKEETPSKKSPKKKATKKKINENEVDVKEADKVIDLDELSKLNFTKIFEWRTNFHGQMVHTLTGMCLADKNNKLVLKDCSDQFFSQNSHWTIHEMTNITKDEQGDQKKNEEFTKQFLEQFPDEKSSKTDKQVKEKTIYKPRKKRKTQKNPKIEEEETEETEEEDTEEEEEEKENISPKNTPAQYPPSNTNQQPILLAVPNLIANPQQGVLPFGNQFVNPNTLQPTSSQKTTEDEPPRKELKRKKSGKKRKNKDKENDLPTQPQIAAQPFPFTYLFQPQFGPSSPFGFPQPATNIQVKTPSSQLTSQAYPNTQPLVLPAGGEGTTIINNPPPSPPPTQSSSDKPKAGDFFPPAKLFGL